ncbi:hypothetical protein [Nonomuraea sp. NPDC005650]|uniref:hypothetical protein n=1 Tax=Nonomuraea sp. NPDC005650 TaxID=3157045 RepID=UPI0033B74E67
MIAAICTRPVRHGHVRGDGHRSGIRAHRQRHLRRLSDPVNADIPDMQVSFVGRPDRFNPVGVKGVGEIGLVGMGAAIANAVHHATSRRIRSLPITIDKLF